MSDDETTLEPGPRQRILDAAIDLFASQGYAATGVREIARTAGVNQAMINYYYGSKINVLKAIFERALGYYGQAVLGSLTGEEEPLESRVRRFFVEIIATMRRHHKLFRVTWSELHYDMPEIAEFKARLVRERLLPALLAFVERNRHLMPAGLRPEQVMPTLPGMVAFHFMVAPVYTRVIGVELDDAFYETFADQLTRLTLHGLLAHGTDAQDDRGDDR